MTKKKQSRKRTLSKKFIPQASIISDEVYIPNYSGVQEHNKLGEGVYCSLYLHEGDQTIALTKDAYTHLTGFTQGLCNNTTQTTDEIVIIKNGIYLVNWSVSAKTASANQTIDIDIFKGGVEEHDGAARRLFGTANSIGNMGGAAILNLVNGDSIDLRAKNSTSDADIVLFDVNLNVVQIA